MADLDSGDDDGIEIPNYDQHSGLYSMKLWHNGQIMKRDGVVCYWEGDFVVVDNCDYDRMSIVELDGIVKERLGYAVGAVYYVKVPGKEDLQYVETDNQLLRCLDQCLLFSRLVAIFCSHPIPHRIVPDIPLRSSHPQLEWLGGDDRDEEECHEDDGCDNVAHDGDKETDEDDSDDGGGDDEFRDSDYEQSDEGVPVNEAVEENLEGLLRKKKGKGISLDFEEGLVIEDSDSDSDEEFGKMKYAVDGDSDSDEAEEENIGEGRPRKPFTKKLPHLPVFNPSTDMNEPHFQLGLLFPNGESFKEAIKMYAIKAGKDIYFRKNEPRRVRAQCSKHKSCPWVCYATKMKDSEDFMVKTYNPEHKCSRMVRNRFATSEWLAGQYADSLKCRKGWSVGDFQSQIKKDHVLDVSRQKAYRAKKRAETLVEGSVNEQFGLLWEYGEELKSTNPGTTVMFKTQFNGDGKCLFQRLYICFAACKNGFNSGCRKLVGLDGCHLKGPHKGQLLTAIGIDANNSLFPIAYAVVESECKDSWMWFLDLLRADIRIYNSHHWTLISDKQKGLEQALKDMWESDEEIAEHRHCARHLQQNFSKVFKGQQLRMKMMTAAMSCTVATFKAHMEDIKKVDPAAFDWLMGKGPKHWCRAYFRTSVKCDMLLNNLCETFNGTNSILLAREKPILSMLERIRMYLLQRFTKQREAGSKWYANIGPRICKILERSKKDAAHCIAYWCGAQSYQVIDGTGNPFTVDLSVSSCSCKKWDLCGIPCCHAIACIWHKQLEPEDFVCDWYKKSAFEKTYAEQIAPIRAQSDWPATSNAPMHPPIYKKQPGRPKKNRTLQPDEVFPAGGTKMRRVYNILHCKLCGQQGHNSRTCASVPTQSQATHRGQRRSRRSSRQQPVQNEPPAGSSNPQSTFTTDRRATPRFKTTARKQVSPRFKTTARKSVNVGNARRLFREDSQDHATNPTQSSQITSND